MLRRGPDPPLTVEHSCNFLSRLASAVARVAVGIAECPGGRAQAEIPPTDPPGTLASFASAPLAGSLDSVGVPVVTFLVSAPLALSVSPADEAEAFGKIYDVAPDGTKTLVQRLVSPIRVSDPSRPVTLTLPGVVHRYATGHRIQLRLAATDQAYIGNRVPGALTVTVDPAHPGVLALPVVSPADEQSGVPRANGP